MKKLNWKGADDSIPLEYPPHIWRYIENKFEQFLAGEHSMTKAYEDYLSLTDDYDYCWGPTNEGESGEDRLWATYVNNAGEVYLLQANEDYTGWERDEFLVFAPSGSRKAAICFNSQGQYEIALEIIPLESNPEIWLISPPYYDNAIRKICDGVCPKVVCYHGEIMLFYQPVEDRTKIMYRMSSDSYVTECVVDKVCYARSVKLLKVIQHSTADRDSLILFYYQSGDVEPLKYITSSPVLKEDISPEMEMLEIQWEVIVTFSVEYEENVDLNVGVTSIAWESLTTTYEVNIDENVNTSVIINSIDWQIINSSATEYEETTEVSLGIQNILWIVM